MALVNMMGDAPYFLASQAYVPDLTRLGSPAGPSAKQGSPGSNKQDKRDYEGYSGDAYYQDAIDRRFEKELAAGLKKYGNDMNYFKQTDDYANLLSQVEYQVANEKTAQDNKRRGDAHHGKLNSKESGQNSRQYVMSFDEELGFNVPATGQSKGEYLTEKMHNPNIEIDAYGNPTGRLEEVYFDDQAGDILYLNNFIDDQLAKAGKLTESDMKKYSGTGAGDGYSWARVQQKGYKVANNKRGLDAAARDMIGSLGETGNYAWDQEFWSDLDRTHSVKLPAGLYLEDDEGNLVVNEDFQPEFNYETRDGGPPKIKDGACINCIEDITNGDLVFEEVQLRPEDMANKNLLKHARDYGVIKYVQDRKEKAWDYTIDEDDVETFSSRGLDARGGVGEQEVDLNLRYTSALEGAWDPADAVNKIDNVGYIKGTEPVVGKDGKTAENVIYDNFGEVVRVYDRSNTAGFDAIQNKYQFKTINNVLNPNVANGQIRIGNMAVDANARPSDSSGDATTTSGSYAVQDENSFGEGVILDVTEKREFLMPVYNEETGEYDMTIQYGIKATVAYDADSETIPRTLKQFDSGTGGITAINQGEGGDDESVDEKWRQSIGWTNWIDVDEDMVINTYDDFGNQTGIMPKEDVMRRMEASMGDDFNDPWEWGAGSDNIQVVTEVFIPQGTTFKEDDKAGLTKSEIVKQENKWRGKQVNYLRYMKDKQGNFDKQSIQKVYDLTKDINTLEQDLSNRGVTPARTSGGNQSTQPVGTPGTTGSNWSINTKAKQ